jgi:hypothetical protein
VSVDGYGHGHGYGYGYGYGYRYGYRYRGKEHDGRDVVTAPPHSPDTALPPPVGPSSARRPRRRPLGWQACRTQARTSNLPSPAAPAAAP